MLYPSGVYQPQFYSFSKTQLSFHGSLSTSQSPRVPLTAPWSSPKTHCYLPCTSFWSLYICHLIVCSHRSESKLWFSDLCLIPSSCSINIYHWVKFDFTPLFQKRNQIQILLVVHFTYGSEFITLLRKTTQRIFKNRTNGKTHFYMNIYSIGQGLKERMHTHAYIYLCMNADNSHLHFNFSTTNHTKSRITRIKQNI